VRAPEQLESGTKASDLYCRSGYRWRNVWCANLMISIHWPVVAAPDDRVAMRRPARFCMFDDVELETRSTQI